jgi:hypothetical protein
MEVLDTPKTITTNITIASFKIQCAVVVLNTTANVNVTLFNASGDNVLHRMEVINTYSVLLMYIVGTCFQLLLRLKAVMLCLKHLRR